MYPKIKTERVTMTKKSSTTTVVQIKQQGHLGSTTIYYAELCQSGAGQKNTHTKKAVHQIDGQHSQHSIESTQSTTYEPTQPPTHPPTNTWTNPPSETPTHHVLQQYLGTAITYSSRKM